MKNRTLKALTLASLLGIAGAAASYNPTTKYLGQKRLDTFAEAYKDHKISQYKVRLEATPNNVEYSNKAKRKYDLVKGALSISDPVRYFRSKGILCFEAPNGSSYVAPIEREEITEKGTKVYLTRSKQKNFKHDLKTFRGYRTNRTHATIFSDFTDGKLAIVADLRPIEYNHNGLEDVWDKEIESNHKLFENKDKKWDSAVEAIYLTYKNIQRDQVEEKANQEGIAGIIAHEDQHITDKRAGLFRSLSRKDIEKRGYLKGLVKDPSDLYGIYRDASRKGNDTHDKDSRELANEILKGIYQIKGVKDARQFYDKISKSDNPSDEISRSAELLWNVWYKN